MPPSGNGAILAIEGTHAPRPIPGLTPVPHVWLQTQVVESYEERSAQLVEGNQAAKNAVTEAAAAVRACQRAAAYADTEMGRSQTQLTVLAEEAARRAAPVQHSQVRYIQPAEVRGKWWGPAQSSRMYHQAVNWEILKRCP